MKRVFLILIGLISLNLYSQDKKLEYYNIKWKLTNEKKAKIRREISKQNDTLYLVTDYLKNGKLYMKGQYSSVDPLIENGSFEFYDYDNYKKTATGYYSKGEMTGVWTIYKDDNTTRRVNYDFKIPKIELSNNPKGVPIGADKMPEFPGGEGMDGFRKYIRENLSYPPMAQHYFIEDNVFVQFAINEKGKVCDVKIVKEVNKDLAREAIRVILESPVWTPGYKGEKAVKIKYTFPIVFLLI